MSEERTKGIVLRTRPLTETSLIVHWLTADAGRIATVARGARRVKSAYHGKLDFLHECELTFRRSSKSELHTLREVELLGSFPGLRQDWRRLTQAAYGVALLEQTSEMDTPMPEAWELFRQFWATASEGDLSALTVFALELRYLEQLGQSPDFDRESLPAGSRRLAERLVEAEWGAWLGREVSSDLVAPLGRFLQGFLALHLGRLPKGRAEALLAVSDRQGLIPPLPPA